MALVASVRIGYSDLAIDWVRSVATPLEAVEHADSAMLEDAIRDRANDVRELMWGASAQGRD